MFLLNDFVSKVQSDESADVKSNLRVDNDIDVKLKQS